VINEDGADKLCSTPPLVKIFGSATGGTCWITTDVQSSRVNAYIDVSESTTTTTIDKYH